VKKEHPPKKEFNFFEVDPNLLKDEWVDHPKMYWQFAKEEAEAVMDHDRAVAEKKVLEEELETVEAEVYLDVVRSDPKKFGLKKAPTVDAINALVATDGKRLAALEAVQACRRKVNKAKNVMNLAIARVHTMDHKRPSLEKLTQLALNNYYAAGSDATFKPRKRE
jgi:hypothetical protein